MDQRARVMVAMCLCSFANFFDRSTMSFAGPAIMKSLTMNPAEFGVILSAFNAGYLLTQIPGGFIADRIGAKRVMVIAPVFWALFTAATGLAVGLAALVGARFLFGASEGFSNASVYKLYGDNFSPQQRARAVSIGSMSIAVAPAMVGPIAVVLIAAFGWRAMFLILAGPALAAGLINALLLPARPLLSPSPTSVTEAIDAPRLREAIATPSFWLLVATHFCFSIPYWGLLGWMPSYLALARHIHLASVGIFASIPYVFAFGGMLLSGWLDTTLMHRNRPQLLLTCYVMAGLGLIFSFTAGSLPLSLAGLSATAFFLFGSVGPFTAMMLGLAPDHIRAAYAGIILTFGQIAGTIAPLVIGFLVHATGSFSIGFAFMIGALAVAALSMLTLGPTLSTKGAPRLAAAS